MFTPQSVLVTTHLLKQPNGEKPVINGSQSSISDLGLTERQLDVLAFMMQGKSNKAICRILNLAEPTVKNHVTAILRALKVSNRTEAVIAVGESGWKLPTTAHSIAIEHNSNITVPPMSKGPQSCAMFPPISQPQKHPPLSQVSMGCKGVADSQ